MTEASNRLVQKLPDPHILAEEIADDLRSALE